ncbi:MAG: hypothetical protein ACRDS0_04290 [Pseudonocardiaceae bacterium]
MVRVLVTGMSGTGKSTALRALGQRGHRVVDTDSDEWCYWVTLPDGSRRETILGYLAAVEPLLRSSATLEIDASAPPEDVVQRLDDLN